MDQITPGDEPEGRRNRPRRDGGTPEARRARDADGGGATEAEARPRPGAPAQTAPPPQARLKRALVPLGILLAAAAIAGWLIATRPDVAREPAPERIWTIAATTVEIGDVRPELRLLGEMVAGRSVELRPLVTGRVVEVGENYVEGGIVREGELLIAIDRFDYESAVTRSEAERLEAKARLDELLAQLAGELALRQRDLEQQTLSQRELARRESLRKRGTGSEKAVDDAQSALVEAQRRVIGREQSISQLEARVDQQKAVLAQMQVAVERAVRDLENTRLTAPFDAFVTDRGTAIGKQVGVGDKVARLIDANWFEVRFHVSNSEFARLVASGGIDDRYATVIWRAQSRDFVFEARIERAGSEVDATSGGVDLFARVRGTGVGTVLRPGMFVEIQVADQLYQSVARLPESALHGDDTVYAVVDGRLEPRDVELVARAGNDVLLRGELRAGDVVATTAFAEIGPGVRVETR